MNKKVFLAWIMMGVLTVSFTGCTDTPQENTSQNPPASQEETAGEDLRLVDDTALTKEKLPTVEAHNSFEDVQPYMPIQPLVKGELAEKLAWQITQVGYFEGTILEEFDSPDNLMFVPALKTALYWTNPISFEAEQDDNARVISVQGYKNHELMWLYNNEQEEKRTPSDFFYVEDVYHKMVELFGEAIPPMEECHFFMDTAPYYYYQREGVFSRVGDFGGPFGNCPLIVSIEQLPDGYKVESIPCVGMDKETPLYYNYQEVTEENLDDLLKNAKREQYTFQKQGDRLVLTAYKILQQENTKFFKK